MNESNLIGASARPRPSPKRVWLFILLGLAMMLLVSTFLAGLWFFISRRSHSAQTPKVIASFRSDFQPEQPRQGWRYYWNDNGPLGNTNSYLELHWNGGQYYVPGDPVPPS